MAGFYVPVNDAPSARPAPASRSMPSAVRAIYPIWKLEAALKCRSCNKGRYAPPVHIIKLIREREITPYVPDEER